MLKIMFICVTINIPKVSIKIIGQASNISDTKINHLILSIYLTNII